MNEKWKSIKEYPNYMISNYGNIKSLNYHRTGKEQLLKQNINGRGYKYVNISNKNKVDLNYLFINHIDENPLNNKADNLEWCTIKYNNNYGNRIKKFNETISKRKVKGEV